MAEVIGLASAIASLVTLAAQITLLSYDYISDIKNASKAQKMYLQEMSALTDVLLRIEEAVGSWKAQDLLNRPALFSNGVIEECQNHLSALKASLEGHVKENKRLKKLKSTLIWPFEEKELKQNVEILHRFHGIFADAISVETL
jgi:predicted nucleic acid-binding protein